MPRGKPDFLKVEKISGLPAFLCLSFPDFFIHTTLGETLWEKQVEICDAITEHTHVVVPAASGVGKTFLLARLALWWLFTRPGAKVITTAPTYRQVRYLLWQELRAAVEKGKVRGYFDPRIQPSATFLELAPGRFAVGFAPPEYEPEKIQGFKGEYVMVVVDEASGVSFPIYEALHSLIRGARSRLILAGNPLARDTPLFKATQSETFHCIKISAFDSPNVKAKRIVIPGLVSWEDLERDRREFGEDSLYWKTRVLGEFPDAEEGGVISLFWLDRAANLELLPYGPVEVGADVARYGHSASVFVARAGPAVIAWKVLKKKDLMEVADELFRFALAHNASKVKVDADGLGAGVVDALKRMNPPFRIQEMHGSGKTKDPMCANKLTSWWWNLAEKLRKGEICGTIFRERDVIRDLTSRRFKIRPDGKLLLEPKSEFLERGAPSPDFGDALALAFAPEKEYPTEALPIGLLKERL